MSIDRVVVLSMLIKIRSSVTHGFYYHLPCYFRNWISFRLCQTVTTLAAHLDAIFDEGFTESIV